MSTTSHSISYLLLFFFFFFTVTVTQANVPISKTFKFVNAGEFDKYYFVEYDATYRLSNISTYPFALCFYNTTPNAYTLGLRMGGHRSLSLMRWVWDANRGDPVQEGATLTFGSNGNLVLTDVDGRVAWQTSTANKSVVGLSLLSNGNLVLYNKNNKFVWQSFDYPTDTLLVGQSFHQAGPKTITSRVSDVDGSKGDYSLLLEKQYLAMYIKSKSYHKYLELGPPRGTLQQVVFEIKPEDNDSIGYQIVFRGNEKEGGRTLGRTKYNSTLSMLRVGSDGTLKVYTYQDKVDWGAWEITYSLFDRNGEFSVSECQLPTRCGSLGVCQDNQCVACPTPEGLLGYTKDCSATQPICKGGVSINARYYKVEGVEHFMYGYNYGEGPLTVKECEAKCDKDCECLGFSYAVENAVCILAPVLGSLTRTGYPYHNFYVKTY